MTRVLTQYLRRPHLQTYHPRRAMISTPKPPRPSMRPQCSPLARVLTLPSRRGTVCPGRLPAYCHTTSPEPWSVCLLGGHHHVVILRSEHQGHCVVDFYDCFGLDQFVPTGKNFPPCRKTSDTKRIQLVLGQYTDFSKKETPRSWTGKWFSN